MTNPNEIVERREQIALANARQALFGAEMARTDVVNPVNGSAPYTVVIYHGQRIPFYDGEWDNEHERDAGSGKAAAYAQAINDSLLELAKRAALATPEPPALEALRPISENEPCPNTASDAGVNICTAAVTNAQRAVRAAFMTAISGDEFIVSLKYPSLSSMQDAHSALLALSAAPSCEPPALSTTRTAEDVREALDRALVAAMQCEPPWNDADAPIRAARLKTARSNVMAALDLTAAIRNLDLSTLSIERGAGELVVDPQPELPGSALCKVMSYNWAHEDAVRMGYPSLTEALEHLSELRALAKDDSSKEGER